MYLRCIEIFQDAIFCRSGDFLTWSYSSARNKPQRSWPLCTRQEVPGRNCTSTAKMDMGHSWGVPLPRNRSLFESF